MPLTMHAATVPVFVKYLTNLRDILDKAQAFATERKIKPEVFGQLRLAPDMHPLTFQVQSATDRPKIALGRLTGVTPPAWEDNELTIADLQARIDKAIAHLQSIKAADVDGTESKQLQLKVRGQDVTVSGEDHVLLNVLPQFFFHVSMAYAILRHAGVMIGKNDYTRL